LHPCFFQFTSDLQLYLALFTFISINQQKQTEISNLMTRCQNITAVHKVALQAVSINTAGAMATETTQNRFSTILSLQHRNMIYETEPGSE